MSNMQFIYNDGAGTFTLTENPWPYKPSVISFEDNTRGASAKLVNYNKGVYNVFELYFSCMGTADMLALGTIHALKKNIEFYPFDETRGTANHYTVRWLGDYKPELVDTFWNAGYSVSIVLEQV